MAFLYYNNYIMKSLRKELTRLYNDPNVKVLYNAEDHLVCILRDRVIAAVSKSPMAYKELGCLSALPINGRTALELTENDHLFSAKAISRTEGWEQAILINESLAEQCDALPSLSERDMEFVERINKAPGEDLSLLSSLLTVLLSPLMLGVIGYLMLFVGLWCSTKNSLLVPAIILLVIGIPLCLFPERCERIRFADGRLPFTCKKCDTDNTVLCRVTSYAVCILIPFIKMPYSFKYYKACASCYIKERTERTNGELLLLTKAGIIKNERITRKEYKKGRCI